MKLKQNICLLFILCFIGSLTVQCTADSSGSGMPIGCAALSNMNFASPSDIETSNFEGPIDLPVTIAKNIDTIDATTLNFEPSVDPSDISLLKSLTTDAEPMTVDSSLSMGRLSGLLPSGDARIGVILDGEFVYEAETVNGEFSLDLAASLLNEPIALVVFEDGGNSSNDGLTSAPVIATVAIEEISQEFVLTIHLTNVSSDIEDADVALDIQHAPITVTSSGVAAFQGSSSSGTFVLSENAITGGLNSNLTTSLGSLLSDLEYSDPVSLYLGINTNSNLQSIASNGSIGSISNITSTDQISVHPTGEFVASVVEHENDTNGTPSLSITIAGLADTSFFVELPTPTGETNGIKDMSLCWADNSRLALIKHDSAEDYNLEVYDMTKILYGTSTVLPTPVAKLTTESRIANPVSDFGYASNIYYECTSDAGRTSICSFNVSNKTATNNIVDGDFDVSNLAFSPSGHYLVFDAEVQLDSGPETEIGFYDPETDEAQFINIGSHPYPAPDSAASILYLNDDITEHTQLALYNLDIEFSDNTLEIDPNSLELSVENAYTFTATGGQPPYLYDLASGTGTVENSGLYLAPNSTGTSTVRVTDSRGEISEAQVTVNGGLVLSFGSNYVLQGSNNTFTITDGAGGPYQYQLISGVGSVSANGVFTAGSSQGYSVVKVTDSLGNTSQIEFLTAGNSGDSDISWGNNNGIAQYEFAANTQHIINNSLLLPDGSILLVGAVNSPADTMVLKLTPEGEIDTSFGSNGFFTYNYGDTDLAMAAATDSSGNIFVAGYGKINGGSPMHGLLFKLTPDGDLASDFPAGTGLVTMSVSDTNNFYADLFVDDSNRVIVTGRFQDSIAGNGMRIARYLTNGTLDPSFDGDGRVENTANSPMSLQLEELSDGKFIVIGRLSIAPTPLFIERRLGSDGSMDPSFNASTGTRMSFSLTDDSNNAINTVIPMDVHVNSSGEIYISGYSTGRIVAGSPDNLGFIVKTNSDGVRDNSFSGDGEVYFDIALKHESLTRFKIDNSGDIIAAGYTASTLVGGAASNLNAAVYKIDGSTGGVETNFGGGDGLNTYDLDYDDSLSGVEILDDLRILASGVSSDDSSVIPYPGTIIVIRLWP